MTASLPVARNGCRCICHRRAGVRHFMACCGQHSLIERVKNFRDSDGSGEAGETRSGSTEGESAGRNGIAQPEASS